MDAKDKVRSFVTTNFYVSEPATLSDDASLLGLGIVDSTGVLELVTFLEGEFGLKLQDEEIVPENLDSVRRIAALISRKQSPRMQSAQ